MIHTKYIRKLLDGLKDRQAAFTSTGLQVTPSSLFSAVTTTSARRIKDSRTLSRSSAYV